MYITNGIIIVIITLQGRLSRGGRRGDCPPPPKIVQHVATVSKI